MDNLLQNIIGWSVFFLTVNLECNKYQFPSQATTKIIKSCYRRKIFNIADDDPSPREEVFEFAQKLVEGKFPGLGKLHISPERAESLVMEKSSRGEKRVSNSRMKKELGVKLIHPTYRSGLESIIEHMDSSLRPSSPGS